MSTQTDIQVPSLLEEFAEQLRELCDAAGVVVLLHLEPLARDNLLVASVGSRFAPEMADEDSAWSFVLAQRGLDSEALEAERVRTIDSADADSQLLCLPLSRILRRPQLRAVRKDERRANPLVVNAPRLDGTLWISISGAAHADRLLRLFGDLDGEAVTDRERRLARFVSLSARLAWQVYHLNESLRDPVSQLPGRKEFETFLSRALMAARDNNQALGLLLINPDDFVLVNHRFGRKQGDLAVREIAERLLAAVRDTDGLFRYGGAVFAVVLPGTDLDGCRGAASKYRTLLSETAYLGGSLNLKFSIGGAVADLDYLSVDSPDQLDMVQRADNALNQTKLAGGGRMLLSPMSEPADGLSHFDPLSGIFTADVEKDYRNMLLLWEAVSLVSSTPEPENLAAEFVDKLGSRFHPDRLALFRKNDGGALEVLSGSVRDEGSDSGRASAASVALSEAQHDLVRKALGSGKAERSRVGDETSYAVPLLADTKVVGCLYLDGANQRLALDSTDLMFIDALANQLAIALDRAALSANWIREKDQESRQLREEVRQLRQAIEPIRPVYASQQMQELLGYVTRIAPSDATVLIIGESGTGKEMLAQSVHQNSHRADGPLVTVDCGAISHTLLEAELFGHVKGAYTGAESASEGRIAQADGGTLFLDEIGELPLDLQSKLLRFVQELEFTPVGGNKTRKVDVRIVAATNRELAEEVAAGRFRQDLYYRLQVVSITAIPLRERPDDILPLADAFLAHFAAQHQRDCAGFSRDAKQKLLAHHWPGNVRELKHAVLRATLLGEGELIAGADIRLLPEGTADAVEAADAPVSEPAAVQPEPARAAAAEPEPEPEDEISVQQDPIAALRSELAWQVRQALLDNGKRPVPIGRWLQDDLVLAVSGACGDVARQGARIAGVPESTFRRQLEKARSEAESGLAVRTDCWARARGLLDELVATGLSGDGGDLLEEARQVLLEEVVEQVAGKNTVGAALMGVTPPTFKRWLGGMAA